MPEAVTKLAFSATVSRPTLNCIQSILSMCVCLDCYGI